MSVRYSRTCKSSCQNPLTSFWHGDLSFQDNSVNGASLKDYEASASLKLPKHLKLIFSAEITSPVFTAQKITGKAGGDDGSESIKVFLVDGNTEEMITTGPLASAKLEMVLLQGDYGGSTRREFKNKIVNTWGKRKNLLLGDLYVHLEGGCGTVGEIRIKQDSIHFKKAKFRLGAMVVDCPVTYVVQEAITDPFEVKDKHILPKRLRPLSLNDKVGRLMNISNKPTSKIRMRLERNNIRTVREFLKMHSSNPFILQKICGIKGKKWNETVNHAKTSHIVNVRVDSTSQQSNSLASDDYDGSTEFDNNCYKPQPYEDHDLSRIHMIEDWGFSTEDVEICEAYFNVSEDNEEGGKDGAHALVRNGAEGNGVNARKRWMKLRLFWFSIVTLISKKVRLCVGVDVTIVD